MVSYTTHYNIPKPDPTDFVDVNQLNLGADTTDTVLNDFQTAQTTFDNRLDTVEGYTASPFNYAPITSGGAVVINNTTGTGPKVDTALLSTNTYANKRVQISPSLSNTAPTPLIAYVIPVDATYSHPKGTRIEIENVGAYGSAVVITVGTAAGSPVALYWKGAHTSIRTRGDTILLTKMGNNTWEAEVNKSPYLYIGDPIIPSLAQISMSVGGSNIFTRYVYEHLDLVKYTAGVWTFGPNGRYNPVSATAGAAGTIVLNYLHPTYAGVPTDLVFYKEVGMPSVLIVSASFSWNAAHDAMTHALTAANVNALRGQGRLALELYSGALSSYIPDFCNIT